jgi:ferritin
MQAQEELGHAMKLFDYVGERGGRVQLKAVEEPQAKFKNVHELFDLVFEHEKKVTAKIYKLYELVTKEGDYASQIELQWFITEQVEEEKNASEIVEQLKMVGDNKSMLLYMDGRMAMRSAT